MDHQENAAPGGNNGPTENGGKLDLQPIKRGRGRPPGSGNKKAANNDAPKSQPGGSPDSESNAAFLADTAVCLLEIADEVNAKSLARKIKRVAPEKADEFVSLYSEVGLNEKDKKLVSVSVTAIAKKYSIIGKFGPEILLLAAVSQYGLRMARLHQFVNEIAEAKAKEEKNK